MSKVLVIGSKGMLGRAVTLYFKRKGWLVSELSRAEFDIAHTPIEQIIPYIKAADFIINCSGVIKPRINVTPIEDILKVNSVFPRNLALLSQIYKTPCIHITTDCVYSGKKGGYTEEDFFDAEDVYGLSKCAGETKDCMTIRTSIVGEEEGQIRGLLEWARSQKGKEGNGFTNHFWNGVTTVYLAEIFENIFSMGLYQQGIFHIFSPEAVSKYKLIEIINLVYQLDLKVKPVEAPERIDRTLSSIYDLSAKVCQKNIFEQVDLLKKFFGSS
ncbi:MAG: sugar nucleotide-binding protein [Candidatus Jordarchaeaceae archaeon]